jgi:hypothetical protein
MGFTLIPEERIIPSPYARADVFMELVLEDEPGGTVLTAV